MMKSLDSLAFIFLLTVFLAINQSSADVTMDHLLIAQVCTKTPYHDICKKILLSGPQNWQGNLQGLSRIATNASLKKADNFSKAIEKHIHNNPKSKDALETCKADYKIITKDSIPVAYVALLKNDKKVAATIMPKVVKLASECLWSLNRGDQATELKKKAETVHKYVVVDGSIINMLQ